MSRLSPTTPTNEYWADEEETRTVQVRRGKIASVIESDNEIELHPAYAAEDPEWEKPTTTFEAPRFDSPMVMHQAPQAPMARGGSSTEWIVPPNAVAPQHGPMPYPQPLPHHMQSYPSAPEYVQYAAPPPPVAPTHASAPFHTMDVIGHALQMPSAPPRESFTSADMIPEPALAPMPPGFTSAPTPPRMMAQVPPAVFRPRLDSAASSTWSKTIPALRRMIGLPVITGWGKTPVAQNPHDPPASISDVEQPQRFAWPPALLVSMAACLVAIVLISIVGLGTRASEAAAGMQERVIVASGPRGEPVTRGAVFIDGATRCEALPCAVSLSSGTHWITVRAPGYETPPSRSVKVESGEPRELRFELTASGEAPPPEAPAVAAQPVPAPAQPVAVAAPVVVDPAALAAAAPAAINPIGVQPPPAEAPEPAAKVKRGVGRLAARSIGGSKAQPTVAGATGKLNINAIPAARVVLDGRPMGETPLMGVKVKPGPHSIVFIGPDGKRAARSTSVSAGETAIVSARL